MITLEAPRLESLLNPSVTADTQAVFGQATVDLDAARVDDGRAPLLP